MLALALLFSPFVNAEARKQCSMSNNAPDTKLNYEDCNNAGKCVRRGKNRTRCKCCNPTDPKNWCYGREDIYLNHKFSGPSCSTVHYTYAVGFGWRFETNEGAMPPLTCTDMDSDPPTKGGIGHFTSPSLQQPINLALKTLEYPGVAMAAACQTCREDNPCNFSELGEVTEGVTVGFAMELNSYYNKKCMKFALEPFDCEANYDLGFEALTGLNELLGAEGALAVVTPDMYSPLTDALNSVVDGSNAACGILSAGCLDWTDTTATVLVKKDYHDAKEFINVEPEPEPTPESEEVFEEEPAQAPEAECSNAEWAQCGGTNFTGETCCPEGTTCTKVVDLYYNCQ